MGIEIKSDLEFIQAYSQSVMLAHTYFELDELNEIEVMKARLNDLDKAMRVYADKRLSEANEIEDE